MSSFFGIKGKRGRHLKHVGSKRHKIAFFGSRHKARVAKKMGIAC